MDRVGYLKWRAELKKFHAQKSAGILAEAGYDAEMIERVQALNLKKNLGRDPETRYTTNGDAVTNIRLATTDTWKDKNGEKQERTEWHNVVFYGRQAEIAGEYLKKGRQIYVEGSLQTREWTDRDGNKRYTTEVRAQRFQMLGRPGEAPEPIHETDEAATVADSGGGQGFAEDDIPF